MSGSISIPVNIFNKHVDTQIHGLINLAPAILLTIATVALYKLGMPFAMLLCGILAPCFVIVFMIITYWYSNSKLTVSSQGLFLRGATVTALNFSEISSINVGYQELSPESILKPIIMNINLKNGIYYNIFICKNMFKTPKTLYAQISAINELRDKLVMISSA